MTELNLAVACLHWMNPSGTKFWMKLLKKQIKICRYQQEQKIYRLTWTKNLIQTLAHLREMKKTTVSEQCRISAEKKPVVEESGEVADTRIESASYWYGENSSSNNEEAGPGRNFTLKDGVFRKVFRWSFTNNLVSLAIFLLHNKMLSGHKKLKTVLEMKFQDKTKSRWCNCAMQKMIVGRH